MAEKQEYTKCRLEDIAFFESKSALHIRVNLPLSKKTKKKRIGEIMLSSSSELKNKDPLFLFTPSGAHYYLLNWYKENIYISSPHIARNCGPFILKNPERHAKTLRAVAPIKVDFTKAMEEIEEFEKYSWEDYHKMVEERAVKEK